ncbi:hypothetical protein AB0K09_28805 [Streptomyces sp. NPDC049577]|uniref:hypothetical protein n=1 Tax=Streptomyces sp. NPDC049577 TaxID=3155153 RepID=UPI0034352863
MLLIYGGETTADAPTPRTGGVPLVPGEFVWPMRRECGGAMQFLAHLPPRHRRGRGANTAVTSKSSTSTSTSPAC